MKYILSIFTASIMMLALTGCADDNLNTSTTAFALTNAEGEALQDCIADLQECSATTESEEEARELCGELYACLPDRETDGAQADDWRAFCEDAEGLCADTDASAEDCAELLERCDESFSGAQEPATDDDREAEEEDSGMSEEEGMCIRTCEEEGGTEEDCAAECTTG